MGISRRNFLKGVAAGALGVTATGVLSACNSAQSEPNPAVSSESAAESRVEAAEVETTGYESKVTRTIETDYVVVGSGMTGMTSAVEAADLGVSVIVLEKNGAVGGSSKVVEGMFGLYTKPQEELGLFGELPTVGELLKQTLEYHHYNCNATVVRRLYEESGENLNWLLEKGVPLEFAPFPVPGMNQVRHAYNGETKRGADAIKVLEKAATDAGVEIMLNTSAKELIKKNGKVCGVYAESGEEVIQINAKAVMLATGGYAGNKEMLEKYAHVANGDFCKDCGIAGRTGDGINMALAAGGAEWKHMGVLQNFGPITKNDTYASDMYAASAAAGFRFNENAVRYADETLDVTNFAFSGNIMQQQKASFSIATKAQMEKWVTEEGPYGGGFLLLGNSKLPKLWEQIEREMNSDDPQVFLCETLDEVASKAGVDAETLKNSVQRYNEMCEAGEDTDFMKDPAYMTPVGEGPYYLFVHKIGVFTSCDGMHVNEYTQVLDANGEAIPGLFAGGMDAGGLMGDAYDVSVAPCSTQGWCVYCGRTAARYVKENLL